MTRRVILKKIILTKNLKITPCNKTPCTDFVLQNSKGIVSLQFMTGSFLTIRVKVKMSHCYNYYKICAKFFSKFT